MGHVNLQYMLHKMERKGTPACRNCGAEEKTSVHILCEFLALEKERTNALGMAKTLEKPEC